MRRLFATALATFMVASACTSSTPPATSNASGVPAAGTPVAGGRIVQGIDAEITGLQPILSGDGSEVVWGQFYPRLMQNNPDTGILGPALAERVEFSPDGLTVIFHLRKDIKWSDGVPFTGEDYKYSVEATIRAKAPIRKPVFSRVIGFQDTPMARPTASQASSSAPTG